MAEVPTTPTATDKLEEVRKLNLEIAKLTSAKDIADRAAKGAQEAAESAKVRAQGIKKVLNELETSQAGAAAEIREFVAEMRNVLQTVTVIMEDAAQAARDLEKHVGDLCAEIEKATAQLKDIRESAALEGETISRKRDDLNIWHERILAAAKKYLPADTKVEII